MPHWSGRSSRAGRPGRQVMGGLALGCLAVGLVACGGPEGEGAGAASPERAIAGAGLAPRTLELVLQIEYDKWLLQRIASKYVVDPKQVDFDAQRYQQAVEAAFVRLEVELGPPGSAKEQGTDVVIGITGHSSGPSFWGSIGQSEILPRRPATPEMDTTATYPVYLQEVARRHPRVAAKVRAVILLGCNAGREIYLDLWGGVENKARATFPGLIALAGFNNTGPLGEPAGVFFRNVLWDVRMNYRDGTPKQAAKLLGMLQNSDAHYGAYKIFDAAGVGTYASKQPTASAQEAWDRRRLLLPAFWDYLHGRGQESDAQGKPWYPPDGPGNVLYDFYYAAQDYITALGALGLSPSDKDLWYMKVGLRLRLFKKEVQVNWVLGHQAQLQALRGRYPALPAPGALVALRRSELLAALRALPLPETPYPDAVDRFGAETICALVDLDPACLPESVLHDPNAPHAP